LLAFELEVECILRCYVYKCLMFLEIMIHLFNRNFKGTEFIQREIFSKIINAFTVTIDP